MQVTIRDTGDLKAVVKELRKAADGKRLTRELTCGIRDELRPIARQIKAAYRSGPSGGGRRPGTRPPLRGLLARATRVEVRTAGKMAGARIRVDGRKMPSGMGSLPRMYEDQTAWRHPVFGDRNVWVSQDPHPTFYRIVEPHTQRVGRRIIELADQGLRQAQEGWR